VLWSRIWGKLSLTSLWVTVMLYKQVLGEGRSFDVGPAPGIISYCKGNQCLVFLVVTPAISICLVSEDWMEKGTPDLLLALTRNLASALWSWRWWEMLVAWLFSEESYPLLVIWWKKEPMFLATLHNAALITLSLGVGEQVMAQASQTLTVLTKI
jgi:hypothetical protein